MTDKELIQALREDAEWAQANEWETPITLGDNLEAAADHLEALLAENERLKAQMPKWRPVSEPPEEYRDEYDELKCFLVCGNEAEEPYRALYDGKHWGDGFGLCDVKWWMPLPEPPSTEGVE